MHAETRLVLLWCQRGPRSIFWELRIIRAHEVKFEYDEPFYSQALGRALLALTQLTKLHLEISHNGKDNCSGDIEDWDWDYIAAEVSRMPQLRCVTLENNNRMVIDPKWSEMTNLTQLTLKGQLERCHNIARLPALQSLDLHYLQPDSDSRNALTPLALETLPGLESLALSSSGYVQEKDLPLMLPKHALASLTRLTAFTLSMGTYIPSISVVDSLLECMPNLQRLDEAGNPVSQTPASGS